MRLVTLFKSRVPARIVKWSIHFSLIFFLSILANKQIFFSSSKACELLIVNIDYTRERWKFSLDYLEKASTFLLDYISPSLFVTPHQSTSFEWQIAIGIHINACSVLKAIIFLNTCFFAFSFYFISQAK